MNRTNMQKQIMQPGTRVAVDSKGRRSESAMGPGKKAKPGMGDVTREFITATERRKQAAGLKCGGAVKRGKRYD